MTPILLPQESYCQGETGHSTHPQVLQQKANQKCSQPAQLWKLHSQYLQQRQSTSLQPQCSQALPTNQPLQSQAGQMLAHKSKSLREGKKTPTVEVKAWTSS